VSAAGRRIGWLGMLHPEQAARWDFREPVLLAELALDAVLGLPAAAARFEPLPRFPAVTRDLSVFVDEDRAASSLEREIRAVGGQWLQSVTVVDRYVGSSVPSGKVSLTLTLRYQHAGRTLTGEEVQQSVDQVVAALQASGVTIRGE
jgi:phenylalanyl-tRNA synthetase beta chain